MSYITARPDALGRPVKLHYTDLGQGRPVVLIHGWPASYEMWEHQLAELPRHGLRVVAYSRRGFGQSSQPWDGYDYDTFADDLHAVLEELDLHDVTLVGFSMGGGEVARYLSRYGSQRVAKAVFVAAVTPFLLQTDDNPQGVPGSVFDGMVEKIEADRFDFLAGFAKSFYGVGLLSHPVSDATLAWNQAMCQIASPRATEQCVHAFGKTDFRADLRTIRVPTLVIHGDQDQTVPVKASGARMKEFVPHAEYKEYPGAPHGLFITEKDRLNQDLVAFVKD